LYKFKEVSLVIKKWISSIKEGASGTLKRKLILGFVVIIVLAIGISAISFFTLRASMSKLDKMVDTTIFANSIVNTSSGIPKELSDYILYKEPESKEKVFTLLDETQNYIDTLKKYMKDEESLRALDSLEDPDKIFRTESRLTDIRHEIEGLTVNLRKLSSLVELSTITINMSEKIPDKDQSELLKSKTYGGRLLGNFLNSVKGVVNFCGELLIIVVQVLPILVLIGLFVMLIIYIYRKVSKAYGKNIIKKDKDIE
jgi:hypothetical protein